MADDEPGDDWITGAEAAAILGLSRNSFQAQVANRGVPVARRGGKPGIRRADVVAYLEASRIKPGDLGTPPLVYPGRRREHLSAAARRRAVTTGA